MLFYLILLVCAFGDHSSIIDIKNIGTLTFSNDEHSKNNFDCIGGTANASSNIVNKIICYNDKIQYNDIMWKCYSDLPNNLELGQTFINCKEYKGRYNTNIDISTCKLSYELNYKSSFLIKYFIIGVVIGVTMMTVILVSSIFYAKKQNRFRNFNKFNRFNRFNSFK